MEVNRQFIELAGNRHQVLFRYFFSLVSQNLLESADLADDLQPGFFQFRFRECLGQVCVEETPGSGEIALQQLPNKIL